VSLFNLENGKNMKIYGQGSLSCSYYRQTFENKDVFA